MKATYNRNGPKGRWVGVQVRSERMDEIAEKRYAAHYKYKKNETLKGHRQLVKH
jgi:GTP pyrophosphokinase